MSYLPECIKNTDSLRNSKMVSVMELPCLLVIEMYLLFVTLSFTSISLRGRFSNLYTHFSILIAQNSGYLSGAPTENGSQQTDLRNRDTESKQDN